MIKVRVPLRICLAGGGTDLPSYYTSYGGLVISASIDRYIYLEMKESVADITIHSDVRGGTGLGSSGALTVGMVKTLFPHLTPYQVAEKAYDIERNTLKQPVGKQDQFMAAYGGVRCLGVSTSGRVTVTDLHPDEEVITKLESRLILFDTGITRSASKILTLQDKPSPQMINSLRVIHALAHQVRAHIKAGDLDFLGHAMHEHWQRKKRISTLMSNDQIDQAYEAGIKAGALGGKIVGAGGGGFLLFYTHDKEALIKAMKPFKYKHTPFNFTYIGAHLL